MTAIGISRHGTWRGGRPRSATGARLALGTLGALLVVGGVVTCGSAAAFGSSSASITVSPDTDLVVHQVVEVTATGLPANSDGYLIECNMAPGEPTVKLVSPVFDTLPVGCSPPTLKRVVSTSADGDLSTTFLILLGRKHVGPPCSYNPPFANCPPADSAGIKPSVDSQNYPCPPTPQQQVAGVTCAVIYLDASGLEASTPITFSNAGPIPPSPSTTGSKTGSGNPTTTAPKSTTTTVASTKTKSRSSGPTTTVAVKTVSNVVTPPATTAATAATATSTGTLPYTGVGRGLQIVFLLGVGMALLGGLLLLGLLRRSPAIDGRAGGRPPQR